MGRNLLIQTPLLFWFMDITMCSRPILTNCGILPLRASHQKTEIHPEGAIFARGACDDKGQMYMHIKAIEALIATDSLDCNVKFLIEGEEEVGSDNLEIFMEENKDRLSCDIVLVSDTGIIANDIPSITVGLRGLSYVEIEVTGPNRDLHSGLYGGAVPNPLNVLSEMLASLKDDNKHINIPGFYNDVDELSAEDRAAMAKAPFSEVDYKKSIGLKDVEGEIGFRPWNALLLGLPWTLTACGVDTQEKAQKQLFPQRHTLKFLCVWYHTKILIKLQPFLKIL